MERANGFKLWDRLEFRNTEVAEDIAMWSEVRSGQRRWRWRRWVVVAVDDEIQDVSCCVSGFTHCLGQTKYLQFLLERLCVRVMHVVEVNSIKILKQQHFTTTVDSVFMEIEQFLEEDSMSQFVFLAWRRMINTKQLATLTRGDIHRALYPRVNLIT